MSTWTECSHELPVAIDCLQVVKMNLAQLFIQAIFAFVVGSLAALGTFVLVALLVDGRLQAGSFHSGAASVLLLSPFAWAAVFWWLRRIGFPVPANRR